MREVKFRAWLPKQGRIYNWNEFYSIRRMIGGKISLSLSQPSGASFTVYDNFTLMQYTGLKDKNGKEIYEGDILRGDCLNESVYTVVCEYIPEAAEYVLQNHKDYCVNLSVSLEGDFEIIGNIYENPELLGD